MTKAPDIAAAREAIAEVLRQHWIADKPEQIGFVIAGAMLYVTTEKGLPHSVWEQSAATYMTQVVDAHIRATGNVIGGATLLGKLAEHAMEVAGDMHKNRLARGQKR